MQNDIPGWEWDEKARCHYRMIDCKTYSIKEWAPTIRLNGLEIENIGNNLQQFHEMMRKGKEKQNETC